MNINTNSKPLTLSLTLGQRLILFLCVTILCFVVVSVLNGALIYLKGATPAVMRISAVLQDLFAFMVPALVTAVLVTRLPARFLAIDKVPRGSVSALACVALVVSLPAMDALVKWNESIQLPQALAGVEDWMRQAEASARQSVGMLMGGDSVLSLIVSVLIVGVLAGLSEELFFRGTFQRLLTTGGLNIHVAIWLVAFIFSASHLQFYGFFGRLLLGAYFGYLLYWTKVLWVPVIAHIFNNATYVIGSRLSPDAVNGGTVSGVDGKSVALICLSVALTVCTLVLIRKRAIGTAAGDKV